MAELADGEHVTEIAKIHAIDIVNDIFINNRFLRSIWQSFRRSVIVSSSFARLSAGELIRLALLLWHRYKPAPSPSCVGKRSMAIERTFSILKPDATRRNLTGAINALIETAGLRIIAQKRVVMTRGQAETFYDVHKTRPFFGDLVESMIAGPVVVQVLEGEDAIKKYRDVLGATDPAKADAGTIRKEFALSVGENSAHGSDAQATAATEIAQWFSGNEIVG